MNTTLTRTPTTAVAHAAAALPRHDTTIRSTRVTARTRRRMPLLLIIAAATAASLPLMGATPAQAAIYRDPSADSRARAALAASGCRAAPYSFSFSGYGSVMFPEHPDKGWSRSFSPVLKTTTQCKDIQIWNTNNWRIRACVSFGTSTYVKCNYTTDLIAGQWKNVATNVKDGTKFRLVIGVMYEDHVPGASGKAEF
ncbi:hypothetical protein [Nucisporomicrobium flavum]|uniref:hypothetical protein n=1 Tax=Nucisporomicrobium flavum TaxID=2785915 RepID=UPI0018F366E0|nr:hypothetical protein [Nucisporomicrobium flavum]